MFARSELVVEMQVVNFNQADTGDTIPSAHDRGVGAGNQEFARWRTKKFEAQDRVARISSDCVSPQLLLEAMMAWVLSCNSRVGRAVDPARHTH